MHAAPRCRIEGALILQIMPKPLGVHRVSSCIDVHEVCTCTCLRDCFRRGNECVRHCQYNIAWLDSRCGQGKTQRVGPAVYPDAKFRIAENCEIALKPFHHWAADKTCSCKRIFENCDQLLLELPVGSNEINKRNFSAL